VPFAGQKGNSGLKLLMESTKQIYILLMALIDRNKSTENNRPHWTFSDPVSQINLVQNQKEIFP
jgi:hypothetical protein